MQNSLAFEGLINEIIIWVNTEILVLANIVSLGALLLTGICAFLLRKRGAKIVIGLISALPFKLSEDWAEFIDRISFQAVWLILVWPYNIISAALNQPAALTIIAGYLLGAWLLIKVFAKLLPASIWVKYLSYLIWIIAVLNIVGIYGAVVTFLEGIQFNIGEFKFSMMLLIRGSVIFIILFWLASWMDKYFSNKLRTNKRLTPSVRVLLQKIERLAVFTVAFILVLSALGIDISAFAVVGGALGVGLGFGLQKIVSNFISGLIIVFDRSIKPGDIIEIDNVFGKVRSLKTRFVSIVTLAGKEYLIPNENFITNQVINWSYSDDLVRIELEIGVAYESDLELVRDLMIKGMQEQERILTDPPPVCLLKEFNDNTVDFELRFWIKDPDLGVGNVKSDVLFAIWKLLKENNISIAFPQRDLHLKSISSEAAEALNNLKENPEKN